MLSFGRRFIVILVLFVSALPAAVMAGNVEYNVPMNHDWWWTAPERPQITVNVVNNDNVTRKCEVWLNVATDQRVPVTEMSQCVTLQAGDSTAMQFLFDVVPGFYRCTVTGDGKEVKKFNIGFEPENIVSLPDAQPDFDEFWQRTIDELAAVDPEYSMTEGKDKSKKGGKVYLVKMKSLGGVEVQGYLTMPSAASKKHPMPVLVHYMGYGSKPWHAEPYEGMDRIEFVLSTRGQGLNEPANTYGDWAVYGLGDRDSFYYRGAFMDLIRAIDFVCTLPEVDQRYIFAEGGSQDADVLARRTADLLISLDMATEVDWKSEGEDFCALLEGLINFAPIREAGFDSIPLDIQPDDDVPAFANKFDAVSHQWGWPIQLAALELNADSYIFLLLDSLKLAPARHAAQRAGLSLLTPSELN